MVSKDLGASDSSFVINTFRRPDLITLGSERGLPNSVTVDGRVLVRFLTHLDKAHSKASITRPTTANIDSDFQIEEIGSGINEIGAITLGTINGGTDSTRTEINITGLSMLPEGRTRYVELSDFDIQRAQREGNINGWIHAQPGNTLPSIGTQGDAADINVSRLLAQRTGIPIHIVLITNRDGTRITGYLYDDKAVQPEDRYKLLKGISIITPSSLTPSERNRLTLLQYAET